ncbi:MAG: DUF4115 domain-containing protein [Candidatus Omnitrophica bacterium]|nr:DUF4115 domain-containing protein [Candidatus Omnitrophota bacterium]
MTTIASQFKKARQQAQLTINDVYLKTKISPDTLLTLEDDAMILKANPLYIKSFLKKYALYLGLDDKAILEQYSNALCQASPNCAQNVNAGTARPRARAGTGRIQTRLVFSRLLYIVFIIFAAMFIFKTAGFVKASFARFKSTRQLKLAVKRQAPPPAKASLPVSSRQPEAAALKENVISIPKNEKLCLVIKLNDDVWAEVKRDGEIVFKGILKNGTLKQWQADDHFELWTGNAFAMELTLNGHDMGSLGRGVKKGIIIDRSGIRG